MRRTPLRRQSKARAASRPTRRAAVEAAIGRHATCALRTAPAPSVAGACFGGVVGHELVKRSQLRGAEFDQRLIIGLCVGHNSWVEDHPLDAQRHGVSIPRWVWDRMGEQALAEAAQLRYLALRGIPGTPSWLQPDESPTP